MRMLLLLLLLSWLRGTLPQEMLLLQSDSNDVEALRQTRQAQYIEYWRNVLMGEGDCANLNMQEPIATVTQQEACSAQESAGYGYSSTPGTAVALNVYNLPKRQMPQQRADDVYCADDDSDWNRPIYAPAALMHSTYDQSIGTMQAFGAPQNAAGYAFQGRREQPRGFATTSSDNNNDRRRMREPKTRLFKDNNESAHCEQPSSAADGAADAKNDQRNKQEGSKARTKSSKARRKSSNKSKNKSKMLIARVKSDEVDAVQLKGMSAKVPAKQPTHTTAMEATTVSAETASGGSTDEIKPIESHKLKHQRSKPTNSNISKQQLSSSPSLESADNSESIDDPKLPGFDGKVAKEMDAATPRNAKANTRQLPEAVASKARSKSKNRRKQTQKQQQRVPASLESVESSSEASSTTALQDDFDDFEVKQIEDDAIELPRESEAKKQRSNDEKILAFTEKSQAADGFMIKPSKKEARKLSSKRKPNTAAAEHSQGIDDAVFKSNARSRAPSKTAGQQNRRPIVAAASTESLESAESTTELVDSSSKSMERVTATSVKDRRKNGFKKSQPNMQESTENSQLAEDPKSQQNMLKSTENSQLAEDPKSKARNRALHRKKPAEQDIEQEFVSVNKANRSLKKLNKKRIEKKRKNQANDLEPDDAPTKKRKEDDGSNKAKSVEDDATNANSSDLSESGDATANEKQPTFDAPGQGIRFPANGESLDIAVHIGPVNSQPPTLPKFFEESAAAKATKLKAKNQKNRHQSAKDASSAEREEAGDIESAPDSEPEALSTNHYNYFTRPEAKKRPSKTRKPFYEPIAYETRPSKTFFAPDLLGQQNRGLERKPQRTTFEPAAMLGATPYRSDSRAYSMQSPFSQEEQEALPEQSYAPKDGRTQQGVNPLPQPRSFYIDKIVKGKGQKVSTPATHRLKELKPFRAHQQSFEQQQQQQQQYEDCDDDDDQQNHSGMSNGPLVGSSASSYGNGHGNDGNGGHGNEYGKAYQMVSCGSSESTEHMDYYKPGHPNLFHQAQYIT